MVHGAAEPSDQHNTLMYQYFSLDKKLKGKDRSDDSPHLSYAGLALTNHTS